MDVKICKWYGDAQCPVLFFIDDLANVWVDTNNNGEMDLGEDWGYAKRGKNSSFNYLENKILRNFPSIKTTFFVPVGPRVGVIEDDEIKFVSKRIDDNEETKKFFKSINGESKYEIAYHGTSHGKVGKKSTDFIQEWQLFRNVDEAIQSINKGIEIYINVFEESPKGGKYCGYKSNEYSDESIDMLGFLWWSRYSNLGIYDAYNTNKYSKYIFGEDINKLTNFDIKFFGKNNVIDIPSTIDGGLLRGTLNPNTKTLKGIIKVMLKKYLLKRKLEKIDFLFKNKLVISIQEHIAPSRNDGKRQTPNIFDDEESLIYIFNYLKNKDVWYCTGTELAEYVLVRENIKINIINNNKFEINFQLNKQIKNKFLSIKLNENLNNKHILCPNGYNAKIKNCISNIYISNGVYKIE